MVELVEGAMEQEFIRFVFSVALLFVVWVVGSRITTAWNVRQKRRELDLESARHFFALYGEFFAVWKLWNYIARDGGGEQPSVSARWDLLERAAIAEGKLEALLVAIACDRSLDSNQKDRLGQFRQLYQRLRESIRDGRALDWSSSSHPDYTRFKELAPQIAALVVGETSREPTLDEAAVTIVDVTSNRHEPTDSRQKTMARR